MRLRNVELAPQLKLHPGGGEAQNIVLVGIFIFLLVGSPHAKFYNPRKTPSVIRVNIGPSGVRALPLAAGRK